MKQLLNVALLCLVLAMGITPTLVAGGLTAQEGFEQLKGLATKLSKAETLDEIDEVVKEARRLTELESHEHVASLLSRQARLQ